MTIYCGFCEKSEHDVKRLIVGAKACICDECVKLAFLCAKSFEDGDMEYESWSTEHRNAAGDRE